MKPFILKLFSAARYFLTEHRQSTNTSEKRNKMFIKRSVNTIWVGLCRFDIGPKSMMDLTRMVLNRLVMGPKVGTQNDLVRNQSTAALEGRTVFSISHPAFLPTQISTVIGLFSVAILA